MLFLYWFGCTIEAMYGSREFLLFYLAAAVVAGLAFVGLDLYTGSSAPGTRCLNSTKASRFPGLYAQSVGDQLGARPARSSGRSSRNRPSASVFASTGTSAPGSLRDGSTSQTLAPSTGLPAAQRTPT